MNQYPIWFGIIFALVMVCVMPNPAWWMLLAAGIGANGIVIAANGWRMPVRGSYETTIRHQPMVAGTRYKFLGDVIPVGFGKASVGDFLLCAGLLGGYATRSAMAYTQLMAVLCLVWWGSGWAKGFQLFEKWPKEAMRDCRKNIPIVLVLMIIGNLLGFRGCGASELRASVENVKTAITKQELPKHNPKAESKWRSLGTITFPPPEMLRRLREATAKQEQQRERDVVLQAVSAVSFSSTPTVFAKRTRSGPFCRVTCAAHHGGQYDVETTPELCRANWIPPNASYVPGWYSISDTEEITNNWPGPATMGFENYKLYWSGLQSEAKVIHASDIGVH